MVTFCACAPQLQVRIARKGRAAHPRIAVGVLIFIAPGVLRAMSPETTAKVPCRISASIAPRKSLKSNWNSSSAIWLLRTGGEYRVIDEGNADPAVRTCFDDVLDEQHVPDFRGPTLAGAQDRRLPGYLFDLGDRLWAIGGVRPPKEPPPPRSTMPRPTTAPSPICSSPPISSSRLINVSLIHEIAGVGSEMSNLR